jgi:hypothetical protein
VGGLGVGHGVVAIALTIVIVALVAYLSITRTDVVNRDVAEMPVPPEAGVS